MTDHGSLRLPDGLIGFPDARAFETRQIGGPLFDRACARTTRGGGDPVPHGVADPATYRPASGQILSLIHI